MTTKVLRVDNVNHALPEALWFLQAHGVPEDGRNGPVMVAPGPVVTEYGRPDQRVLFSAHRDANPFFHLMECLWMIGGRNDVEFVSRFNGRMASYSDDGDHLHGAYGFRWREWFGFDQIEVLLQHLRVDPKSRRAVLAMWSPMGDLISSEGAGGLSSKDLPCNTHCYIDGRGGKLNLTVCCRSNDAVWGAYGANAVHFSFLQEYFARHLGLPIGKFIQFSNNLHVYTETFSPGQLAAMQHQYADFYYSANLLPFPLIGEGETMEDWDRDLRRFLADGHEGYYTAFFNCVASPMRNTWELYKAADLEGGLKHTDYIDAGDWQLACAEWLKRRIERRAAQAAA